MAGSNDSFDVVQVRDALLFAMRMGSPNRIEDKATFHFRQTRVWRDANNEIVENPRLDQDGNPFDGSLRHSVTTREPVVLDEVAVEFSIAKPEELEVGSFRATRVELTILDAYWQNISDAVEVALGGDRYYISYEKPVIGLFDLDVHQLVCYAKDEA